MYKAKESVTAELIYQAEVICGESPVWDEVAQELYWIDMVSGDIFIFNPLKGLNIRYNIGSTVGALTLCEKGGLLMAKSGQLNFFDPDTGNVETMADISDEYPEHFFNDGKCDPNGRFWVGTYHQDANDALGVLYSLESDLSIKKRIENIILSNGLAWSMDHKKFYYIDSIAQCVYDFDYDIDSGDISDQRILRKIHGDREIPDGMTIDIEGFLWIAVFNLGKVIRVDPVSGETVFEVLIPNAKQVTSCTFGGKDFDELYITTAKEVEGPYGIPENEISSQQNAGGLFKVKLPFKGIPAVRFKH